nr:MAG TPA: PORTAL PROTEIN, 15 PROTEIN, HEAD PROTEIN, VIRAL INFECTION, TAILED.2A [Caudoviricetes sp.]
MGLEQSIKAALEGVRGLSGHVYTAEALRDEPLFAFYRVRSWSEEDTLGGGTGLETAEVEIHIVAESYAAMTATAALAAAAVKGLRGVQTGGVYIERVRVSQQSPDLKEMEVNKFRRAYVLRIDYQEGD